jgi:hypothetical protein
VLDQSVLTSNFARSVRILWSRLQLAAKSRQVRTLKFKNEKKKIFEDLLKL